MKDILVSVKPYYYYLIGEGIKTEEIRKSMPKSAEWSESGWFYMSKDEKSFARIPKELQEKYRKHFGKVGLSFDCNLIRNVFQCNSAWVEENACISKDEFFDYLGIPRGTHMGYDKKAYSLHIKNTVVYNKPKELSEFYTQGDCDTKKCENCVWFTYDRFQGEECCELPNYCKPITRPPQSWCYVEELGV